MYTVHDVCMDGSTKHNIIMYKVRGSWIYNCNDVSYIQSESASPYSYRVKSKQFSHA